MPTYYTVVRYLPSALAEEFVNVGVVVFGDGAIRSRFLSSLKPIRSFAGQKLPGVDALRELLERDTLREEGLRQIMREWCGSVQFSEPRASLMPAEALLERLAKTFLYRDEPEQERRFVDKRKVKREAFSTVRNALMERIPLKAEKLLKMDETVRGELRERTFDLVVKNGAPIYAAQAFSFWVDDAERVLREVEIATFEFEDVRKKQKDLPVAAIILAPVVETEPYDAALRTLRSRGVKIVQSEEAAAWAKSDVTPAVESYLAKQPS